MMHWFYHILLILGGLFGVASCNVIESPSVTEKPSRRYIPPDPNASLSYLIPAARAWPKCIENRKDNEINCLAWNDNDIEFRVLAIKGELGYTPVVEANLKGFDQSNDYVIHMTGGPGGVPYSSSYGPRTEVLKTFMQKGFKIISIGYWGSRFRTTFAPNEINLATKDFQSSYNYYSTKSFRTPLVVAESLGVHILYQSLDHDKFDNLSFIAASPAILGLKEGVNHFNEILSEENLRVNSKSSFLYKQVFKENGEIEFAFQGGKLFNSFDHLDKFSQNINTAIKLDKKLHKCSKIIVGEDDPLNLKFLKSDHRKFSNLQIIKSGHEIYEDNIKESKDIFEKFISCNGY